MPYCAVIHEKDPLLIINWRRDDAPATQKPPYHVVYTIRVSLFIGFSSYRILIYMVPLHRKLHTMCYFLSLTTFFIYLQSNNQNRFDITVFVLYYTCQIPAPQKLLQFLMLLFLCFVKFLLH